MVPEESKEEILVPQYAYVPCCSANNMKRAFAQGCLLCCCILCVMPKIPEFSQAMEDLSTLQDKPEQLDVNNIFQSVLQSVSPDWIATLADCFE